MKKTRGMTATVLATCFLLAAFCGAARADWNWQLSPDRYKKLNQFERQQYERAEKEFQEQNYRGAAAEFEKFKAQFGDSEIIPYVAFMRGLCLHNDKKRAAAIKIYQECLDFFPDDLEVAAPCLYHMGLAYVQNGEIREGLQVMQEFVDDKELNKHPLTAQALVMLADNYWKDPDKQELAVKCWKQVVSDFIQTNRSAADAARRSVTAYYIKRGDYAGYENWLVEKDGANDAAYRFTIADGAWIVAYNGFRDWNGWDGEYTSFNREKKQKDMLAFLAYFRRNRKWYEETKREWYFYDRLLSFTVYVMGEEERDKSIDEAIKYIKERIKDREDANGKYAWIVDRLRDVGQFDKARFCNSMITDPDLVAWKEYEILYAEKKYKEAAGRLKDIIKSSKNAPMTERAQWALGDIYREWLGDYKEAVAIYQQLNKPPTSLWRIQDAYRRWGKMQEALNSLAEIENFFPDDASRAACEKGEVYRTAGMRAEAIAAYRRVLKVYPKSQDASRAHQRLEDYGVETGGGLTEE